jgi:hypothetical protein
VVGLVGVLALGGGALVRAQQAATPYEGAPPPTARSAVDQPVEETPPPPVVPPIAKPAPPEDAADLDEAPVSAAPVKPAPAKPVEPMKRPRFAVAVIQALDKITAETVRFEVPVNHPVRYKSLVFTVSACETTAPDEDQSDAAAHVEIVSQPKIADQAMAPAREVFRGWMFANSPGLHLFQHPVYDAWLIACKTASPPA